MPELPEVEVTRLSFASRISGARILARHMGKPLRWPLGVSPADSIYGKQNLMAADFKIFWQPTK
jgi:formamidopyrimidine-DNA glycosylase